mmetsp:Transcript_9748/g.23349  ORF Transcript_9748/g.23349 Transcript_9748/m.23349 type:complete len:226 (-) Transcript_9748:14-691(-)
MEAEVAAAAEEVPLSSLSVPMSAVKRLTKNAVPSARWSQDALAGLNRMWQVFTLYAVERSLNELKTENHIKAKGKAHLFKKTVTADHTMRFLQGEMPHVATKLCNLFPEVVPQENRPTGIKLLEEMHKQFQGSVPATSETKADAEAVGQRRDAPGPSAKGSTKRVAKEPPKDPPKKKQKKEETITRSLTSFFGHAEQAQEPEGEVGLPAAPEEADELLREDGDAV